MNGDEFAVIGMLLVLILILIGAYFTTRIIGLQLLTGSVKDSQKKLAVVHRLQLGRDQQLAVVRVGNRHLLIGCTQTTISFITNLSMEESELFNPDGSIDELSNSLSFSGVLSKIKSEKIKQDESIE